MPCLGQRDGERIRFSGHGKEYRFQVEGEILRRFYPRLNVLGRNPLLPVVPARVFSDIAGRFSREDVPFVLDTGATITYIPRNIAYMLGLDLRSRTIGVGRLQGVGGSIEVHYLEFIQINICGYTISIPVAIPIRETPEMPFPLLGRQGVLEHLVFAVSVACTHVFHTDEVEINSALPVFNPS
jgi:hypothetical protein